MNRFRYLSWPAYVVTATLLLLPLAEFLASVWPLHPGEVRWRFGAVGLFSGALLVPVLAVLLAYAVALLLEHRMVQRVISVLSGLVALLLVAASVGFILDTLQMRSQVRPEAHHAFDVASALGLAKLLVGALGLVCLSLAGWRSAGHDAPVKRGRPGQPTGPVVMRPVASVVSSAATESAEVGETT